MLSRYLASERCTKEKYWCKRLNLFELLEHMFDHVFSVLRNMRGFIYKITKQKLILLFKDCSYRALQALSSSESFSVLLDFVII